jgi:hypothetical protein
MKLQAGKYCSRQESALQVVRRKRVYYRVAIRKEPSAQWQWKSTLLSSLDALFRWFRLYAALPQDCLRVFTAASREEMREQLARENQGLGSTSIPAAQFLRERRICCPKMAELDTRGYKRTIPVAVMTHQTEYGESRGAAVVEASPLTHLERRREELEQGAGGDHDIPYLFTVTTATPQVLAWMRLREKVQQGELQHGYVHFDESNH